MLRLLALTASTDHNQCFSQVITWPVYVLGWYDQALLTISYFSFIQVCMFGVTVSLVLGIAG